MKKTMALILTTMLLISAASCGSAGGTTTSEGEGTAESTSEASAETTVDTARTPDPTEITLDGSFAVVYGANASESEKAAAQAVYNAMQKKGMSPLIYDDAQSERANEILVGNTVRSVPITSTPALQDGDFTIGVSGSSVDGYKISLIANSDVGIELASSYFVFTYVSGDASQALSVTLAFLHKRSDVTFAGKPLSSYTVVYAKEGASGDKDIQAAKYQYAVLEFIDLLEKATGVRLNAVVDGETLDAETPLILFGNTSHKEDNSIYTSRFASLGISIYSAKLLDSGYIALAGNNACSALAAGEALIYSVMGETSEIDSISRTGTKELIHVACIGDSITYGTNSDDPSMQNYPVYLQRMLGYEYYVEKYGAPGHSLIETDTSSFLKHTYFKQSASKKPDVVLVMLGTNDCRSQKWEDSAYKDWSDPARKEAFVSSGQKLIDAYRSANEDVQIIFATCPMVPQDAWLASDWTSRIVRYGNPLIRSLAEENGCPVIDVFSYSREHSEMFDGGDGLHPQNEKYGILAEGIYGMVKDIIKR